LCVTLSAERIYRTMADCLEKDEVSKRELCFAQMLIGAGCGIHKHHGSKPQQQSDHCS
jgi:hypothetical protein